MKVGVVVGRFQVPSLTSGHTELLLTVLKRCEKMIVVVGTTPVRGDTHDPLPFECVKQNILRCLGQNVFTFNPFERVSVLSLEDHPSDETWSTRLDELVKNCTSEQDEITMYGGRSSFLDSYLGGYDKCQLSIDDNSAGTDVRKFWIEHGVEHIRENLAIDTMTAFNAGIVYGSSLLYPTSYQCVDILAHVNHEHIVLIRKPGCKHWQLPGGFVDVGDDTLESAAVREFQEETGIKRSSVWAKYVCSQRINDYRYRNRRDKVMTSLFEIELFTSDLTRLKAADDVEEAFAFKIQDVIASWNINNILPGHLMLIKKWWESKQNVEKA